MKIVLLSVVITIAMPDCLLAAQMTKPNRDGISDPDSTLSRMRLLAQDRKWQEIVEQFDRDVITAWPAEFASQASEALVRRGQAHSLLKNGQEAEVDLRAATKLEPNNALAWMALGDNYVHNLNDESRALVAYRQSLTITGPKTGWQPLTTTLAIARILTNQVKTEEALAVLRTYDGLQTVPSNWRVRLLRAYGHAYAAAGREQESLAKFREALQLESQP